VQALVLHHTNYGEADRFLRLLTAERGKISALARGVRRMNSRKAGHLEPFTLISAQLSKGHGTEWIVDQVSTLEAFPSMTEVLDRTIQGSYVTELADRFTVEEIENRQLFRLTLETIRRIASMDDPFFAIRFFDLRLLDLAGYRPQLQQCVICGKPVEPVNQYFSAVLGGIVCPSCSSSQLYIRPITVRTLKFLRYYQNHNFQDAAAAGWPQDIRSEGEEILTQYIAFMLERKINSQEFLSHLRDEKI
jgi:DNA repair protein RecO (recombination protein O)